jgi:DNA-binding response OmpR family regulator
MPITVLLIESDAHHAQAVVDALADPWSGWRVDVSESMAQARARLSRQVPDIVLVAQRTVDGSAFDLLQSLTGVPAIIIVRAGAETHAAQALRHGFDDFAVQDTAQEYLLSLPSQIEAVLERSTSARAREQAEALLARQHRLLQAITRAQAMFIASAGPHAAFAALLDELMALTHSEFGLVGQVQRAQDGHPFLRVHAMTDISWDAASRKRLDQHAGGGMVFDNVDSLVGAALVSESPVISNNAAQDPRSAGPPPGHPPIHTYLGLPIQAAGELVAMVGLANRAGGYTEADVHFLQPLLSTVGQLELARRAETARCQVEAELARTSELLAEKTRTLEVTLASVSQGISKVDAEGRIRIFNRRYLELLDLPEALLASQPFVDEVVQFQTARGDFGPDFGWIEPTARDYVGTAYAKHGGRLTVPDAYVRRTRDGRYIEVRTPAR